MPLIKNQIIIFNGFSKLLKMHNEFFIFEKSIKKVLNTALEV